MNIFKKVGDYFLKEYKEADFVRYKKAQFLLIFSLLLIFLMILLTIIATTYTHDRFISTIIMSISLIIANIPILISIKKGKETIAANLLAVISVFLSTTGFLLRPPHLAGATMGVFMHAALVFIALFCSTLLSSLALGTFLISHIFYFFIIAKPVATGLLLETVKGTLVDAVITLIIIFAVGVSATKFLEKAIEIANDELKKNKKQFKFIKTLIDTIKETANKLTNSITNTTAVTNNISDNAQSQAASIEELSATIEEISAGTTSVNFASKNQTDSIEELVLIIEEMSKSIDNMEEFGKSIALMFQTLIALAEKGEDSSNRLDSINLQILDNSNKILFVVNIMEEFFEKINLLALNASIEAARAGEHGRGFAVVAEEIGKLSDHSTQELKQVSDLIDKNKHDVDKGNEIIVDIISFIKSLHESITGLQKQSLSALHEIKSQKKMKDEMNKRTSIVEEKSAIIENSMNEQERAIDDVSKSIEITNNTVQKNAENTETLRKNAAELKIMADELMKQFNTEEV